MTYRKHKIQNNFGKGKRRFTKRKNSIFQVLTYLTFINPKPSTSEISDRHY